MPINFGVPTDLTVQGNLTVDSLNGVLKATNGLVSAATAGTDYATPAQLTSTGVQLGLSIEALSGYTVAAIASTGQQAWGAANNNGINLSGALTQTGVQLRNIIDLTGQQALTYANGIGAIISGNLTQTGVQLAATAAATYATISNLANTGQQAWNVANNNGINLSGNLTQTGIQLIALNLLTSGIITSGLGSSSTIVHTTGAQTITGLKTWNSGIFFGTVGVGTATPNLAGFAQMTLAGAAGGYLELQRTSIQSAVGNSVAGFTVANGTTGRFAEFEVQSAGSTNSSQMAFYTMNGGLLGLRMLIGSGGNVGIGTANPDPANVRGTNLTISGGGGGQPWSTLTLVRDSSSNAVTIAILDGLIGTGRVAAIGYVKSTAATLDGNIVFSTSTGGVSSITERARITSSGNIGVGTAVPLATLDIVSSQIGAGTLMTDASSSGAGSLFGRYGSRHFSASEEPFYYMLSRQTSTENRLEIGGGTSVGNAATTIRFYTAPNNTTTVGTEKMRIDETGNVGIGTAAPYSLLNIVSPSTITDDTRGFTVDQYAASARTVWRRANGTISSPSAVQNGDALGFFGFRGYTNAGSFPTSSTAYIQAFADENFTASAQGGHLEIGTTPRGSATNAVRIYIADSGNIGIGTTNPVFRLDVSGNARVINSVTASGFTVSAGVNSYSVSQVTGNFTVTTNAARYVWSGDAMWTGMMPTPTSASGAEVLVVNQSDSAYLFLSGSIWGGVNYTMLPKSAATLWSDAGTWHLI